MWLRQDPMQLGPKSDQLESQVTVQWPFLPLRERVSHTYTLISDSVMPEGLSFIAGRHLKWETLCLSCSVWCRTQNGEGWLLNAVEITLGVSLLWMSGATSEWFYICPWGCSDSRSLQRLSSLCTFQEVTLRDVQLSYVALFYTDTVVGCLRATWLVIVLCCQEIWRWHLATDLQGMEHEKLVLVSVNWAVTAESLSHLTPN